MEKPKAPIRSAPAPKKKKAGRGILKTLGTVAGGALGGPEGSAIGSMAADAIGDLFGFGDYTDTASIPYEVNSNSSMGFMTPDAAQIPAMHTENGSVRIRKREYIRDISMTAGFVNIPLVITPKFIGTFPWLHTIARNFEQYKFLGLAFAFRSLAANAIAGSPAMGSITLATQYDVAETPYTSKAEASNALFATSCKPSENMLHPCECDPEQTPVAPLYLTNTPSFATEDLRFNFFGLLQIITQGGPATAYTAGELWVTYDVMFYKPQLPASSPPPLNRFTIRDVLEQEEKDNAALMVYTEPTAPPSMAGPRAFPLTR